MRFCYLCVGISAMPVGANIFPVVTLNNGTVAAVADARNAGVSQPDIIVAGAGLSSVRSGLTVTLSNSVINGAYRSPVRVSWFGR